MKKPDDYKKNSQKRITELFDVFVSEDNARTQQAFADECGISKFSMSQYLNGQNAPGNITAAKIANRFNVNPLWVMGFDVERTSDADRFSKTADVLNKMHPELLPVKEKDHLNTYRKLSPKFQKHIDTIMDQFLEVQERENALTSMKHMRDYPYFRHIAAAGTGVYFEELPIDTMEAPLLPEADYIIGVSGDSMEPTFFDGEDVYVKKVQELSVGDIGIFLVDNQYYIKELGEHELMSHNPQYPNIPAGTSDIRCMGKVLGKVVL